MIGNNVWDNPHWFAIYTHPRQEGRAENNLRSWGVETFNPKLRGCRPNTFTGRPVYVIKSFFSRYIFARFTASELLRKVCLTRGVHSVVSFGGTPIPVCDEIISIIKSQTDKDGLVWTWNELELGDKVVISDGMFRDFVGVFKCELRHANRVMILLTTINYQGSIVVRKESVRKAAS
jgi:transcriptional antiterminator RfaH